MKYGLLTVSVVYMSEMLLAISQFHLVYMLARFNYSDGQLCDLSNDYCTKCEALGSQRCGKCESHMYIHSHSHYRVRVAVHLSSSLRQFSGPCNQADCFSTRNFNLFRSCHSPTRRVQCTLQILLTSSIDDCASPFAHRVPLDSP